MSQPSTPASPDDFENVYAAPGADPEAAWETNEPGADPEAAWEPDEPAAESIRREFAPLETFVKAVGLVNYVYALLIAFNTLMYWVLAILIALGWVSAPWMSQWEFITLWALETVFSFLAVIAGYGLTRLKRWAPRAQAIVCLIYFLFILVLLERALSEGSSYTELALILMFGVGWELLIIGPVFLDLDELLSDEYRSVLERTPHIKIKPRMPLSLMIAAGLMIGLSIAGCFVIEWN